MDWVKYTIKTTHGKIDSVIAKLSALGYDQLEIEDIEELKNFIEHEKPFWQLTDDSLLEKNITCVSFYVDPSVEVTGLDGLDVTRTAVCDTDWMDNWKQYYKPIKIGKRILIQPEWEPPDNPDNRAVFRCDPGVSFGTGTHATTRLCLEFLDKTVKNGDSVIDLGCGSGILSVTAMLLGAKSAIAVDIDSHACDIARRNAERNGTALTAVQGNLLEDDSLWETMKTADIVCANLVADLITTLAPRLRAVTCGCLIVSGILSERADEVCKELERAGFSVVERLDDEGWTAIKLM
jgi:ribosomal protein L11 methyltransferase